MFKREYILQKVLLTISLIFILVYAGRLLPEKHGLSAYEAQNFTIANSSESLGDSPYLWPYPTAELEQEFRDLPYLAEFPHIWNHIEKVWGSPDSSAFSLTTSSNYTNTDWIENTYYDQLLHVDRNQVYQFGAVTDKCIATQKAPLYYWILHFFSSLFDGVGMYYVAFVIHAVILFYSAFLLFMIGEKYLHSGWAGFSATVFYGLCMGCFTNLFCATPYLLATFFILVCAYLNLSLLSHTSLSLLFAQFSVVANILGNLTDYSFTLFSFLFGGVICITLLCYGRIADMCKFIFTGILSALITLLIYPATLLHLSSHILVLKKHVGPLFSSGGLITVFQNNCQEINNQTFTETALLIGVLLLVLIVFASYFKKRTFNEVYEDWYQRLVNQDIADMLFIIIGMIYFLAICFINPAEPYFVLSTLLPILCLMFCYFLYHLSVAILHTEQNGGLLCMIFVSFICIYSLNTNTIRYIYTDNATNLEFASAYEKEYCLFLSSESMTVEDHLLELETYEHSLVSDAKHVGILKENETFQSLSQVLVYISNEDYTAGIADTIAEDGSFNLSKELYNYRDEKGTHIYVYLLQKLEQ